MPQLTVLCRRPDGNDPGRAIDMIGGVDEFSRPWHLPLEDAVAYADRSAARFVLPAPAGRRGADPVPLEVATSANGTRYLRADAGHGARLGDVPRCTHTVLLPPILDGGGILGRACAEAIAELRERDPGALPSRLQPGEAGAPLRVAAARARDIVGIAAVQALADTRSPDDEPPSAVVWQDGADELLVLLDSIQVTTGDGTVTVTVDVACDEVPATRTGGRSRITVDLVVGTASRPTGMLAAAPAPQGDALIVQRWGDQLIALAWRALLDAASGLGAASGSDSDGRPLIPVALTAAATGLTVAPQARFDADRSRVTAAGPLARTGG
ncbi:hypothetical protein [Microbacterium sp. KR10-403]|uniref:hypothetical protein n=1 Tax=Microbacterium sp. KR10-403 TaxID=3158581 RepID=UPI0032E3E756